MASHAHQTETETYTEATPLRLACDSGAIAGTNLPAPVTLSTFALAEERLHRGEFDFELGDYRALQFWTHADGGQRGGIRNGRHSSRLNGNARGIDVTVGGAYQGGERKFRAGAPGASRRLSLVPGRWPPGVSR